MIYTDDGLWAKASVAACSVDVASIDITVNGGIIEKFINLFKKQIAAFIKKEVSRDRKFAKRRKPSFPSFPPLPSSPSSPLPSPSSSD